jgi:predicted nucleotidyltransferase
MNLRDKVISNRDEILKLSSLYGAREIKLIGSVARGDFNENSDIDFLVDFEPGRSLLDHANLAIALEKLLKTKVEIASKKGLKTNYRDKVLKEAVPL